MKRSLVVLAMISFVALGLACSSESKPESDNAGTTTQTNPADQAHTGDHSGASGAASQVSAEPQVITKIDTVVQTVNPWPDLPAAGQPIVGKVVDVIDYATGGAGTVDKAKAQAAIEKGRPLGLLYSKGSKSMVLFVAYQNGQSAADRLATLANYDVGISGSTQRNKAGQFVVIAEKDNIRNMR